MPDTTALAPVKVPSKGRKGRLVTLADLDQRTRAAQRVNETIRLISSDLGGADHLSTAQRILVERVAVQAAIIEDIESRWAQGLPVDTGVHSTMVNALRRNLETIGLKRVAKDAMSLGDYIAAKYGNSADDEVVEGEIVEADQ